ncbi:MAG: hypothetical protein AAF591_10490 [Verrucomicrobiota bacterium]
MRTFAPKSSPFTPTEPEQNPAQAPSDQNAFSSSPNGAETDANNGANNEDKDTPNTPRPPQGSAEDRLSTIRELLVGDQINVLNDRFATLETSLQAHSSELVDQIKSKFDAAYNLYKVELEDMGESVKNLKKDHEDSHADIRRINDRLDDINSKYDDLKSDLSRQTGELYEEISKNVNQLTNVIKEQYDELSNSMVAKTDLANLFGNLSAAAVNPQQAEQNQNNNNQHG